MRLTHVLLLSDHQRIMSALQEQQKLDFALLEQQCKDTIADERKRIDRYILRFTNINTLPPNREHAMFRTYIDVDISLTGRLLEHGNDKDLIKLICDRMAYQLEQDLLSCNFIRYK